MLDFQIYNQQMTTVGAINFSAVMVSIFGFAVGFGRFFNKNCGLQFLVFYGSKC